MSLKLVKIFLYKVSYENKQCTKHVNKKLRRPKYATITGGGQNNGNT